MGWWDKMNHRVETDDNVNLVPFKTIDIYQTWGKQNLGNFVMLLPLGIYFPLLYRKLRKAHNLFVVLLTCSSVPTGQRSNFLINDLVSLTEFGVGLQDAFGRPD